LCLLTLALAAGPAFGQTKVLDEAIKTNENGNAADLASQARIDEVADDTEQMASSYRASLEQIESLRVYNAQLERLIAAQEEELLSLDEQIGNVTLIGREMTPLMLRMIDSLEAFIEADVPMLLGERRERVAGLRELMDRADVANSEKYRRIMEAYQIENDYGRTIESYQDDIEIDGEVRTLEVLRVGRVALLYTTLDGSEAGAWDQRAREWVALPSEYRDSIRQAVRIARKQAAPDLVRLPILAPEEAN
jgi:tetratricopeptide (TPR) repeat protein